MSELAAKRMSLAELLRRDDGNDRRWELIDGFPVSMAPPAEAHRILAVRLASRIDAALRSRRPLSRFAAIITLILPLFYSDNSLG